MSEHIKYMKFKFKIGQKNTILLKFLHIVNSEEQLKNYILLYFKLKIFSHQNKKSGVALTQLSLTLHYSRRIFY